MKDLLTRKVLDRNVGPVTLVNTDVMGPGYQSAYGLVMGIHIDPKRGGFDNQIRTHGSVDYTSIARRFSHGCHRLVNNRAVRLFDFVLRHRAFRRIGNVPLNLKKRFEVDGETYHYALKTRGYYYELRRAGRRSTCSKGAIMGEVKKPITAYVRKPGVDYGDDPGVGDAAASTAIATPGRGARSPDPDPAPSGRARAGRRRWRRRPRSWAAAPDDAARRRDRARGGRRAGDGARRDAGSRRRGASPATRACASSTTARRRSPTVHAVAVPEHARRARARAQRRQLPLAVSGRVLAGRPSRWRTCASTARPRRSRSRTFRSVGRARARAASRCRRRSRPGGAVDGRRRLRHPDSARATARSAATAPAAG